ncbi:MULTISPECIES: porin OmpC [Serratia]|uniref:Porin OmpC n=3 Tax=Enterobacterales TaxID=91347 RepID=A0ABD5BLC9_SERMA|nr:porin OmpC [Serratia marcescens]AUU08691.1 porin OmpC [Serratia marcescens]MCZ6928597.1 porin OmpC [Serratia marcescens]MDE5234246.1 porin OmpC [Serratia marcescens]MDE5257588.1 porin OmpC [Serratia marcescens]MDP8599595.1 porin OmpC [Serratia marcescens]
MMKRNILAVVIPALLAAGAANAAEIYNKDGNKLDLYGKVDGLHYFSDDEGNDGDQTYVRFGFKGETQITDQLTGYGQWEYNVQSNHAESQGTEGTKTRLGFAGLKFADYGSFDYGRNYGVLYDVEGWTDMLPEFGGDTYTYSDNFMTGRTNGVATYRNNNFFGLVDGLNFAVQYQGKNENDGRALKKQNGDGWGLSSTYDIGEGVSFGAAYASSDRTDAQTRQSTAGGDKADAWTVGAKYDANNVYLAAMYAETRNMTPYGDFDSGIANKTQNFEVTAQYQFDFGLRPEVSYLQSKGKNLAGRTAHGSSFAGGDADLVKYVSVGTTYYFNKNMSTYVDYKINLLDDNEFTKATGTATDDIVAVGLVYQF